MLNPRRLTTQGFFILRRANGSSLALEFAAHLNHRHKSRFTGLSEKKRLSLTETHVETNVIHDE